LVPSPDSGTLRLKKSYSKNALADIGFTGADAFHLVSPDQLLHGRPEAPPAPQVVTDAAVEIHAPAFDAAAPAAAPASAVFAAPAETPAAEPADTLSAADIQAVSESVYPAERFEADNTPISYEEQALFRTLPEPEPEPPPQPEAGSAAGTQDADAGTAEENPAIQSLSDQLLSALLEMTSNKAADNGAPAGEPGPVKAALPDGWQYAEIPAALFVDPDISKTCQDVTNALVRTEEDHVLLAVPISPEEPFSMMPVFCFGTPRQIDGSEYIVFKIKDGYLTL
jgi:hypothetical protein